MPPQNPNQFNPDQVPSQNIFNKRILFFVVTLVVIIVTVIAYKIVDRRVQQKIDSEESGRVLLPAKVVGSDPLLEKYGLYPTDTFKNYPEVLANLKNIDPKFTDLDMGVSSGNKIVVFQDGRKMLLMKGCFPHACAGSEKIALYDPTNNNVYLQTKDNYFGKTDNLVEKFLSETYSNDTTSPISPIKENSKTYSNLKGGYMIYYPEGGTLSFIDRSSNPENCVVIKYGLGFIDINNGASDPCTITGMGAYDKKVTDIVTLSGGSKTNATGFLSPENTSFASFELNPDIWVTYGVTSNTALSENDYQKSLSDIKSILSTLRLTK